MGVGALEEEVGGSIMSFLYWPRTSVGTCCTILYAKIILVASCTIVVPWMSPGGCAWPHGLWLERRVANDRKPY